MAQKTPHADDGDHQQGAAVASHVGVTELFVLGLDRDERSVVGIDQLCVMRRWQLRQRLHLEVALRTNLRFFAGVELPTKGAGEKLGHAL